MKFMRMRSETREREGFLIYVVVWLILRWADLCCCLALAGLIHDYGMQDLSQCVQTYV